MSEGESRIPPGHSATPSGDGTGDNPIDGHVTDPVALARQLDATNLRLRDAQRQLDWASAELRSIRTSAGWAFLQRLYRIRFALFPRGSLRERLAAPVLDALRGRRARSDLAQAASPLVEGGAPAALRLHSGCSARVIVFAPSVAWSGPLMQRTHHLARAFARHGCTVVYCCSDLAPDDGPVREVEPGLFLYGGPAAALVGLPNPVLWTLSYNFAWRDAFAPEARVVYDWIDDLDIFPQDRRDVRRQHERALGEAAIVVAVSRQLEARARVHRADVLYVPNAADVQHFATVPVPNRAMVDPEFVAIIAAGRPIAGYYGALAAWFDTALLCEVAKQRQGWSFVLIGPDLDSGAARTRLERLPNVYFIGARDYDALPGYLHRFDVALIPFKVDASTAGISPLKLYEYLAAAKPVVATALPECALLPEVRIAGNATEFARALDAARVDAADPEFALRARSRVAAATWDARATFMLGVMAER
jgi:glycosyltransferase involved in cell wall biosynthesis